MERRRNARTSRGEGEGPCLGCRVDDELIEGEGQLWHDGSGEESLPVGVVKDPLPRAEKGESAAVRGVPLLGGEGTGGLRRESWRRKKGSQTADREVGFPRLPLA